MMKLIIQSTNIDLSPRLRKFIETRIGPLDKFISGSGSKDKQPEARVELIKTNELGRVGEMYEVETNIRVPGKILRATSKKRDIMAAIVHVKELLHIELTKYKESQQTKVRKGQRLWKRIITQTPLALGKRDRDI